MGRVCICTETEVTISGTGMDIEVFVSKVEKAIHVVLQEQALVMEQYNIPKHAFEDSEIYLNQLLGILK